MHAETPSSSYLFSTLFTFKIFPEHDLSLVVFLILASGLLAQPTHFCTPDLNTFALPTQLSDKIRVREQALGYRANEAESTERWAESRSAAGVRAV